MLFRLAKRVSREGGPTVCKLVISPARVKGRGRMALSLARHCVMMKAIKDAADEARHR